MWDLLSPHLDMLAGRVSGPFSFRFILQPLVAVFFAVRAALADVRDGRPPYGWAVLVHRQGSGDLLREAWGHVARVFIVAATIDVVYQIVVLRWFYPGQALIVASVLAILPYLLIRGKVNRMVRTWRGLVTKPK